MNMQDPIQMTMLVLAIIVVVTFTVLSLVYPTEEVATIALAKRMQYESLACSPLGEPIDEYIVRYSSDDSPPLEIKKLTKDMADELRVHAYSVEKISDPLGEITSIDAEVIDVVEKHNAILSNDDQDEWEF